LGLAYTWSIREGAVETRLSFGLDGSTAIIIPDVFFPKWDDGRPKYAGIDDPHTNDALLSGHPALDPGIPFIWQDEDGDLPLIFFANHAIESEKKTGRIHLPFDLPGAVFFFLSRYEELGGPMDAHGRFPGARSWAARHGLLQRPVVDEYERILRRSVLSLWPGLILKEHSFRVLPTHDVDWPFVSWGQPGPSVLKNAIGDVLKRRDISLAFRRIVSRFMNRPEDDPAYTYDYLMDLSEELGLTSTFFIFSGGEDKRWENRYRPDQPEIRAIIKKILERNHRIGLHGSYHSLETPGRLKGEADRLRRTISSLGFDLAGMGGRQHYLRGAVPILWKESEKAGLSFDSTLGYADRAGFRAGTSREYQPFDIFERKAVALRVKPLIVMDTTLIITEYSGFSDERAMRTVRELLQASKRVGGEFQFLWHNSSLMGEGHKKGIYRGILSSIQDESRCAAGPAS